MLLHVRYQGWIIVVNEFAHLLALLLVLTLSFHRTCHGSVNPPRLQPFKLANSYQAFTINEYEKTLAILDCEVSVFVASGS